MGERIERWDHGKLIEIIDTRVFEEEKTKRIAEIKEQTKEDILTLVPQHTQSNIALGIISEEEASSYVNIILQKRAICNQKVQQVMACNSLSELDAFMAAPIITTSIELPPIPQKANATSATNATDILPDKPSDLISYLKNALTKLSEIMK